MLMHNTNRAMPSARFCMSTPAVTLCAALATPHAGQRDPKAAEGGAATVNCMADHRYKDSLRRLEAICGNKRAISYRVMKAWRQGSATSVYATEDMRVVAMHWLHTTQGPLRTSRGP